ncbi:MAG: hypothetical protein C4524_14950 [Candidatus Zixiibacteriota bacterium]|nr:MAG: hypothetical protein C4524_14950 [candidate division Zixibacteria bacterium]
MLAAVWISGCGPRYIIRGTIVRADGQPPPETYKITVHTDPPTSYVKAAADGSFRLRKDLKEMVDYRIFAEVEGRPDSRGEVRDVRLNKLNPVCDIGIILGDVMEMDAAVHFRERQTKGEGGVVIPSDPGQ